MAESGRARGHHKMLATHVLAAWHGTFIHALPGLHLGWLGPTAN